MQQICLPAENREQHLQEALSSSLLEESMDSFLSASENFIHLYHMVQFCMRTYAEATAVT